MINGEKKIEKTGIDFYTFLRIIFFIVSNHLNQNMFESVKTTVDEYEFEVDKHCQ